MNDSVDAPFERLAADCCAIATEIGADSVLVLITHKTHLGTHGVHRGAGNTYANREMARTYIVKAKEDHRCDVRKASGGETTF